MNASVKRITATICIALSLGAIVPAVVNADPLATKIATRANTGDKGYTLKFKNNGKDSTDDEQKQDASSTYIRAARKDMASCRLYVEAKTGIFYVNETVYGYATLRNTGQWRIRQDVFEHHGESFCRITAWGNNGGSVIAGEWSPDSWGSYIAINGG